MKTSISSEDLSQSGAEKITLPLKPDGQTDISIYIVASQLKIFEILIEQPAYLLTNIICGRY